ncbi:DNA (cytosine-5)-methyltransferase 3B [Argonauta hians]
MENNQTIENSHEVSSETMDATTSSPPPAPPPPVTEMAAGDDTATTTTATTTDTTTITATKTPPPTTTPTTTTETETITVDSTIATGTTTVIANGITTTDSSDTTTTTTTDSGVAIVTTDSDAVTTTITTTTADIGTDTTYIDITTVDTTTTTTSNVNGFTTEAMDTTTTTTTTDNVAATTTTDNSFDTMGTDTTDTATTEATTIDTTTTTTTTTTIDTTPTVAMDASTIDTTPTVAMDASTIDTTTTVAMDASTIDTTTFAATNTTTITAVIDTTTTTTNTSANIMDTTIDWDTTATDMDTSTTTTTDTTTTTAIDTSTTTTATDTTTTTTAMESTDTTTTATATSTSSSVINTTTTTVNGKAAIGITTTATTISVSCINGDSTETCNVNPCDFKRKLRKENSKANHTTNRNGIIAENHSSQSKKRKVKDQRSEQKCDNNSKKKSPKQTQQTPVKNNNKQNIDKNNKNNKYVKKSVNSPNCINSPKDAGNKTVFPVGSVIWGKLSGFKPWPGLLLNHDDIQKKSSPLTAWVLWFGDYKISELPISRVTRFDQFFHLNYKNPSKVFSVAVTEALEVCAERSGLKPASLGGSEQLLSWAKKFFMEADTNGKDPFLPAKGFPYPKFAWKKLEPLRKAAVKETEETKSPSKLPKSSDTANSKTPSKTPNKTNDKSKTPSSTPSRTPSRTSSRTPSKTADKTPSKPSDNKTNSKTPTAKPVSIFENDELMGLLKSNKLKIQDVCIGCKTSGKEIVSQHPLFEGGLCQECKENILETIFALDTDNTHAFCTICCESGKLCICSIPECNRVYCNDCVESWVGRDAWDQILSQNPWPCFLCRTSSKKKTSGYLQPKSNWSLNIMQMFNSQQKLAKPDLSYLTKCQKKPPIRVLSLFDGIGTGRVALDQLGLTIKEYYSSEIDSDALIVKRFTYGETIKEIGDITELTEDKLAEMCPFDLVIGGSPCNDLSLVNPARKGFSEEGTGILFFEFCRILSLVQRLSKDRHVFWLYENVAAMKTTYKAIISRFLGCKPALWDAKFFSAQHRPRYFWGNLPTIYSSQPTSEDDSLYLDKILSPNCNRKARVKQLRTVTTRSNSLRQGKNEDILPVEMDGEEDAIWITELEKIFGFPAHYTDVRNLNHGRRQRLLGRAWSVPVIKFLLSPLTKLFHTTKTS